MLSTSMPLVFMNRHNFPFLLFTSLVTKLAAPLLIGLKLYRWKKGNYINPGIQSFDSTADEYWINEYRPSIFDLALSTLPSWHQLGTICRTNGTLADEKVQFQSDPLTDDVGMVR